MKKIFSIVVAVILLTGCNKDNHPGVGDKVAVQFNSGIITRAIDNNWSAGDKIGIFMVKTGQPLTTLNIVGTANNIEYNNVTEPGLSGSFSANNIFETIYFPVNGSLVDFYAYYPYSTNINQYKYSINVVTQSNQENIDLMTAKTIEKVKTSPAVILGFRHRLAKLKLTITAGEGVSAADLTNMEVTVIGLPTTASYNLANETLSDLGNNTDITIKTATDGTTAEAILIPVSATPGAKISFKLSGSGEIFYWDIATMAFDSGKKYDYTVSLNRTEAIVSGTISDWVVSSGNGTAN